MEHLCDEDTFWDSDLTWYNNTWPQFTECFENTVLTWIPCGYLLLLSPVYVAYLVRSSDSKSEPEAFGKTFILKQLFSVVTAVVLIGQLANATQRPSYFIGEVWSCAVWILIMILHMFLVTLERRRGLTRFPILFVFWILGSITLLIQLHSSLQTKVYNEDLLHFILLVARYVLSCLLFVLHCFASHGKWMQEKDSNPYSIASLPSLLFFLWMEPFILKGFKRPLQDEDIPVIPPQNTTVNVISNFFKNWEQEKKCCERHRRSSKTIESVQKKDLHDIPLQIQFSEENIQKSTKTDHRIDHKKKPSFTTALLKTYWSEAVCTQVGQLGRLADHVISPFILGFFIDFISNQELTWHGYIYTISILLLKAFATVTNYPSSYAISLMALRLQSTAIGSVFRKALTISSEARKKSTTGEIINLMSVDGMNLKIIGDNIFWMWLCVLYFIFGVFLTYSIVGFAILPGIAFIFLMLLSNVLILHKMRVYQSASMKVMDERLKMMNEILNGIKVIKLYGWEAMFMNKLLAVREKELKILLRISILEAIFNFAWGGALFWMNYFILVTFVMTDKDHYLDANTAFVTLSYIGLVRIAVNTIPSITQHGIKATTSLSRLNKFMNAQDLSPSNLKRDTSDDLSVRVANANFAWEKDGYTILKDINLEVERGKLIAVVGTVGCGKSSLLSAMLGEMYRISGYANLNSSVAYVPQQAWIQNASVKDNILFGSLLKYQLYESVLKNCCLMPDLKIMPAGDKTEIGEKGINISGGQKQRISLARAVYSQADIYLLDDPLSAVDSHVGRHIFDNVIGPRGCLQGKTRILVTHGIQWLPEVDEIIVMTNGEITETGSFKELVDQNGDFAQFLSQYFGQHSEIDEQKERGRSDSVLSRDIFQQVLPVISESDSSSAMEFQETHHLLSLDILDENETGLDGVILGTDIKLRRKSHSSMQMDTCRLSIVESNTDKPDASRLTTDEKAVGGRVAMKIYWHLWRGVGCLSTVFIIFFIIGYHVTFNYANYWVAVWNDDSQLANFTEFPANSTDRLDRNVHYIAIYTIFGLVQTLCGLVFSFLLYIRRVEACRKLHAKSLASVMKAPMSFFDTTPIGRILNRFSQDIEVIDNDIFFELCDMTEHFLKSIGILITISFTLPWSLVMVIPILFMVFGVQKLFTANSCQVRRLASNKRSPIYAHFSETLSGASVIRAYRAQDKFINESNSKVDDCQKTVCAVRGCNRWMLSRLDMVTYIVIGSVCIYAVIMRDELTPGIIGLVVSYAFSISLELCLTVERMGMLETHSVCVERVREYSVLKSEAPWTTEKCQTLKANSTWPSEGSIQFINYSTRYRKGLDLVLKTINCHISGGEKIGIVGRTGAGKSSMVLSLFRLIEAVSGRILIDGVDISQIGLHTLRHNITILPQDPVLFAGSIRMNLDPHEEKTDSEIWTALEHSHLKSFVLGLDAKLDHDVGESGENLSMGQRQLLCLARTLLRKTKILVLDEATAAVDMDTDDLIQKTIRTEFSECTIMTIAHRLNTVMDYDRILVFESGNIIEFDSPSSLLADPNSHFYSMSKDARLVGKDS